MLTKETAKNRNQVQFLSLEDIVPQNHLLRQIEKAIDWSFIYDLVEDKYSPDFGRPSMDPVTLIKIPFIQYLYGIKSMRQTIKDIEVNAAYRWFLGIDFTDAVPHFTTFGKNYTRRFKDTDLFEQIFQRILEECYKCKLVDPSELFVDSTHVKARANNKKYHTEIAKQEALFYEKQLKAEINEERIEEDKKPYEDDDSNKGNGKEIKVSNTDPESGWFHKGEHKEVFAYSVQTACDKYGWIINYDVNPGNLHDSRTFKGIYDKIKETGVEKIVADSGYITPAIAKLLLDDGILPVFPYKASMTKKGFFKKHEYVYDEYYDCYICPNNEVLKYSTINRDGYREYKSNPKVCENCPNLNKCTSSKNKQKVVSRHIWEEYLETCNELRYVPGIKELYNKRKETIERIFGTAKENHGFRYTQMYGIARMKMKAGLTYACLNLKKLAKIKAKWDKNNPVNTFISLFFIKNYIFA